MNEITVMDTINIYVLSRITKLFDADELTEKYAQKLEYMGSYATAEEILGTDAPEEDKEYFVEHMIEQKDRERVVKDFKKTLEECYEKFQASRGI